MAKQSITVELDDETIRCLALVGTPLEVLARLACAAAQGMRDHHAQRDQTNVSLKVERDKADDRDAMMQDAVYEAADEVVRITRWRADQVVQTAGDSADREHHPQSTTAEASSNRAVSVLQDERSNADAVLEDEREQHRRSRASSVSVEREATDKDLTGERTNTDTMIGDLREANEQMVGATIRAQELQLEADEAKERAEQNERELREVAEFREMFIGILGHDLRTPLASIVMATGLMLERGNLDDQDSLTVARIIRNSQRMTRMITQLLDLTRARLGAGLPIEPEPTDLREVLRNVVEDFDAPIQLEIEGDLTGTWDQDRLAEVFSNLAGNAIEYATRGTTVIVKARAEGAVVVVETINQGPPIPADVLPFIFEPFRRARQREKSATGNLGLGLYIAHQIVLSHGGTLEGSSADGSTTFVVRLPRRAPTGS
jgi:signal transduction histidine kinase